MPIVLQKEVQKEPEIKKEVETVLEEVEEKVPEPTVEDNAREKGWVPKEEFKGDPNEWVPAKEFVERGPLYDTIHKLNRKIKKMEKTLEAAEEHFTKVAFKQKEKEIEELKKKLEQASADNDIKTALEVKDQINDLQKEPVPKDKAQVPSEYFEWAEKNTWYDKNKNPDMYKFATSIGYALQAAEFGSPSEIYEEVTRQIRGKFPDKFEEQKKVTNVTTSSKKVSTNTDTKKKHPSVKQLPEEARINYRRLVKSDTNPRGVLTPDKFWANYDGPLLED